MWILILYYVADADESCILEKLIRLLIVILIILRTWYMQIIWNITPAISLCFHYHFMAASQDNMTTSLVAFAWELWILKLTFVELLLSSLCNWSLILNIPLLISPWAYTVWNLCTVNSMHATYDSALHSALWIAEFFFSLPVISETKNQWARDDPAFVVILILFLVFATSAYCAA